jgi:hypothetical protein
MDKYRLPFFLCEFAKKIIACFPVLDRSIRKFWLMHSSPLPFDLASAMPAVKMML